VEIGDSNRGQLNGASNPPEGGDEQEKWRKERSPKKSKKKVKGSISYNPKKKGKTKLHSKLRVDVQKKGNLHEANILSTSVGAQETRKGKSTFRKKLRKSILAQAQEKSSFTN